MNISLKKIIIDPKAKQKKGSQTSPCLSLSTNEDYQH